MNGEYGVRVGIKSVRVPLLSIFRVEIHFCNGIMPYASYHGTAFGRTPDGQSGSFLRKQCENKLFGLGVFGEFHRIYRNLQPLDTQ